MHYYHSYITSSENFLSSWTARTTIDGFLPRAECSVKSTCRAGKRAIRRQHRGRGPTPRLDKGGCSLARMPRHRQALAHFVASSAWRNVSPECLSRPARGVKVLKVAGSEVSSSLLTSTLMRRPALRDYQIEAYAFIKVDMAQRRFLVDVNAHCASRQL